MRGKLLIDYNQRNPVKKQVNKDNITNLIANSKLNHHLTDKGGTHCLQKKIQNIRFFNNVSKSVFSLKLSLNSFNTILHTSTNYNKQYDKLFDILQIKKLSNNELLIITTSNQTLILHSNDKKQYQNSWKKYNEGQTNKFSKVAINSSLYLNLYNELNWYLDWKLL